MAERRGIAVRPVLAVGGAVALVTAVAVVGAAIIGPAMHGEAMQAVPPHVEEAAWRNEQLTRLHSYGWIDRERDIAHIPIERAMQLLVEEAK